MNIINLLAKAGDFTLMMMMQELDLYSTLRKQLASYVYVCVRCVLIRVLSTL